MIGFFRPFDCVKSKGQKNRGKSKFLTQQFMKLRPANPTEPTNLAGADYDADEAEGTETITVEVELVSHEDKTNWFVFEVELDENTEMKQVSAAANKVVKLPIIPEQEYRIKFVISPSCENHGTSLVGHGPIHNCQTMHDIFVINHTNLTDEKY